MAMIRGRTCNRVASLLLVVTLAMPGCSRAYTPLDLDSPDPGQDQRTIASYHSREAVSLRNKADELAQRVVVYEGLFGRDSEWVTGARLLVQFYTEAAEEQERLATFHLAIATHEQQASRVRPIP